MQKTLSMLTKNETQTWLRSAWFMHGMIKWESLLEVSNSAPYPAGLAKRLMKILPFTGNTVLDLFAGTGWKQLIQVETAPLTRLKMYI